MLWMLLLVIYKIEVALGCEEAPRRCFFPPERVVLLIDM